MEDVVEDLGYDIALPMVDHSLVCYSSRACSHKTSPGYRAAGHGRVNYGNSESMYRVPEATFIFITTYADRMNVKLVLAADTLHHMPLNEQVLAILSDVGLREKVAAGQWVSGYKLTISLSVGDDVCEVFCEKVR